MFIYQKTANGRNSTPYDGAGADDINSDTQGLALMGGDGKPLDVTGKEITLFIDRDTTADGPPDVHEFDVDDGAMKVHKFNLSSKTSSMAIEILPVDPRVSNKNFSILNYFAIKCQV